MNKIKITNDIYDIIIINNNQTKELENFTNGEFVFVGIVYIIFLIILVLLIIDMYRMYYTYL